MNILNAIYFDGRRSHRHSVSVIIAGGSLKVIGREVNERFDAMVRTADEAITLMNQVLQDDPNQGDAFAQRGRRYQQQKN